MSQKRVTYYYDPDVGGYNYGLGHLMKPHRMRVTHELVSAYGMLPKMRVLRAKRATAEVMCRFHTDEYINFLSKVTPETATELTFNVLVGDDNPPFEGVFEFCTISAGGSVAAAQRLASGATDIAINWAGGLHHAKKREASGFCFVNDIVLCILELLRSVPRVLYIDIDCHHGDGVEEAFYTTDRVMTCSFHKFGEFFPGTGDLQDRGRGRGKGYAVNVPLKDGIGDEPFRSVFEPVIDKILEVFRPSTIVLQCGADSLAGDKLGCLNLTMQGHAHCVQYVRDKNIPLVLLGGGGYTVKNVARTWTYETACALRIEDSMDPNMPWNDYFEWFGPRYRLEVVENNMDDMNVKEKSLDTVRETVLKQLSELQGAPSVGLQDVPSESVGEHLGLSRDEEYEIDELDQRLAQHAKFVYDLQERASSGSDSDSDTSRRRRARPRRRGKKRMSIVTNSLLDIPHSEDGSLIADLCSGAAPAQRTGPTTKRRFFQSAARWDEAGKRVVYQGAGLAMPLLSVAEIMERGAAMPKPVYTGYEEEEGDEEDTDMDGGTGADGGEEMPVDDT